MDQATYDGVMSRVFTAIEKRGFTPRLTTQHDLYAQEIHDPVKIKQAEQNGILGGLTNFRTRTVGIATDLPNQEAVVDAAIHELAHIVLNSPKEALTDGVPKPLLEAETEMVAAVVTAALGIDTELLNMAMITQYGVPDEMMVLFAKERTPQIIKAATTIIPEVKP
jgi:hypothetical protein